MIRSFALSLSLILLAGVAQAQQTAPRSDELVALNFYVQQHDQASINAELRRLQLKYPNWQPPADLGQLSATSPSREIDQIYRQIAGGQFDQARQTIATTQTNFPQWVPPNDMVALLEVSEGQVKMDAALQAGNLQQALQIAGQTPGLMRCNRINNAWRIASLQEAAGQKAEAYNTYRAVARACVSTADVMATLEKADLVTTDEQLKGLFSEVGTRLPEMKPQLDTLEARLFAGRGVAAPVADAAPLRTAPATPEAQAQLRPVTPKAPRPVEEAPVRQATVAPRAVAPAQGAAPAGFQQSVSAGDWRGCVARAANATAPAVIYQRGWCHYNLDQAAEAIHAFETAQRGKLSQEQRRDARYGMALAYLKMRLPEEASRLAVSTDFTRSQRVDIERQILDQRGVAAYKRGDYRKSIEYFNAIEDVAGTLRRDLAIMRAYAYLNTGNRSKAHKLFTELNNRLSTKETTAGMVASAD